MLSGQSMMVAGESLAPRKIVYKAQGFNPGRHRLPALVLLGTVARSSMLIVIVLVLVLVLISSRLSRSRIEDDNDKHERD